MRNFAFVTGLLRRAFICLVFETMHKAARASFCENWPRRDWAISLLNYRASADAPRARVSRSTNRMHGVLAQTVIQLVGFAIGRELFLNFAF